MNVCENTIVILSWICFPNETDPCYESSSYADGADVCCGAQFVFPTWFLLDHPAILPSTLWPSHDYEVSFIIGSRFVLFWTCSHCPHISQRKVLELLTRRLYSHGNHWLGEDDHITLESCRSWESCISNPVMISVWHRRWLMTEAYRAVPGPPFSLMNFL